MYCKKVNVCPHDSELLVFELTDGVKTKVLAVCGTPCLDQLFSQTEHELHQLQLQERPQEEPKYTS